MVDTIVYSESFRQRLEQLTNGWGNELLLSKENIRHFTRMIDQSINRTYKKISRNARRNICVVSFS